MKENKIAFITYVTDQNLYQKSLSYINRLQVVEDIEIEIIPKMNAKSITSAYNEAMQKSDAKYKVYLHEDVYIQNENFINDILKIFKSNQNIGLIGMVGAKIIPVSGIWWEDHRKVGKVFDNHKGFMELQNYNEITDLYTEVKGIGGFIMITQYDLPWREDIFHNLYFYDVSQSVEFLRKGLKVIVPSQKTAWCIHYCGLIITSNEFEESRNEFLDSYSKDILPLVSILIPTYNQTKYLGQALDSALNQTYRNTEIIIGDDSTTGDVQKFVEQYMLKSNKIKYINNGGPLGCRGKNNSEKLFKASSGVYINFLHHDDIFNLDKIDKMINYFLYDDTLSLITSYRNLINENGEYLNDCFYNYRQYPCTIRLTGEEAGKKIFYSMINYIGEPTTAMFNRKYVDFDISDYDNHEINFLIDVALWLKLLKKGNMIYISDSLSKTRIHNSQNSSDTTFTFWSAIEFFNMVISSYENKVFIKSRKELLEVLISWHNSYASFLIKFTNQYNNGSENNTEMMKLRDEFVKCYTRFVNILLEKL